VLDGVCTVTLLRLNNTTIWNPLILKLYVLLLVRFIDVLTYSTAVQNLNVKKSNSWPAVQCRMIERHKDGRDRQTDRQMDGQTACGISHMCNIKRGILVSDQLDAQLLL
jgi:hypothetical protein